MALRTPSVDANGDLFIAWTRVVMGVDMNDNVFLPASELREKYDEYEGLVDEINEAVGTTLGDATGVAATSKAADAASSMKLTSFFDLK